MALLEDEIPFGDAQCPPAGEVVLQRAQLAGWRLTERDVAYHPRAAGTRSKVSGSIAGSLRAARDFAKVLG